MDRDALVVRPKLEGVEPPLGDHSVCLDAAAAGVVARDEELPAGLAVGEPEFVARQEPVGVVCDVKLAEGGERVGSCERGGEVRVYEGLPEGIGVGVGMEETAGCGCGCEGGGGQEGEDVVNQFGWEGEEWWYIFCVHDRGQVVIVSGMRALSL